MWYLVLSHAAGQEEGRRARLDDHMTWLLDEHRAGRVLFSGPTSDKTTGIFIVLAGSREEAEEIASADPHHIFGDRKMEVVEWDAQRSMRLQGPTIAEIEAMARDAST
jgi:uncharacterized protein YciI